MKCMITILVLILAISLISEVATKIESVKRQPKTPALSKETNADNWGNGSVYFLDRHNVQCNSGSALKGFHLYRPQSNQISIQYDCLSTNAVSNQIPASMQATAMNDSPGDKTTNYLDRHAAICPTGQALQQFKLQRNSSGNKFQYRYTCVSIKSQSCATVTTPTTDAGNFSNIYLDRQYAVNSDPKAVLTGFKLNTVYGNPNRFTYTLNWCTLLDVDSEIVKKKQKMDTLGKQFGDVDKQIRPLKKRVTNLRKQMSNEIVEATKKMHEQICEINSKINPLKSQEVDLKTQITTVQKEITNLSNY